MAITTRDQLINAMANNSSRLVFDKAATTGQTANTFASMWRATGQPGQGAIPATAAVCNTNTAGAVRFNQQTDPVKSNLTLLEGISSNSAMTFEIHDRLAAMGGLLGNVATAQTVGLDLEALLTTDNLEARIGDADYSDVLWWLEWYATTGTTAVTATVNVTYADGTTGNLSPISLAASRGAQHAIPLNGSIPAGVDKRIRGVNSVTLSATTGTAGNFGVTATRYRAAQGIPLANLRVTSNWADLGIPEIHNNSCLFAILLTSVATTGTLRATGKISHG